MAINKTKEKRLRKLYKQLARVQNQPSERVSWHEPEKMILTLRGRIEQRIKTLENTK